MEQSLAPEVAAVVSKWMTAVADRVKNPLASFTMGLEQIQEQLAQHEQLAAPIEFARLYELVERMQSRVSYLVSYVDEISWFTKPICLQMEWHNLSSFLNHAVVDLRGHIRSAGQITCINSLPSETKIYADIHALHMVLRALVINAIEANAGIDLGSIDINIDVKALTDRVEICIRDNGVGFSEEILQKLGQPFFSTKEAGAGLGLAITAKLISAHRGNITFANSQTPKGGIVTISFPLEIMKHDNPKGLDQ